ncbi:hypothetical protein BDD12DRAFT_980659, partial [Trichophaea hybrida]
MDNYRDYNGGSKHVEFSGSTFHGEQKFYLSGWVSSEPARFTQDIETTVMTKLETSTFLDLLLPMTDHHEHISKTSTVDPDDPKLYWILRDADFKIWELANTSQVLWLFGGPPGCPMTEISSLIAKQEESRRDGAVFYFSCSMEGFDAVTTFTHSLLRHILNGSNPRQAKSIIETFLGTLLLKIIQRDPPRFKIDDSSVITVEEILSAGGRGLLGALTEAVVEMNTLPDTPIIIDGIDKMGPDGSRFLTKFCSHPTASPKPKVLLTCRPDPNIKERAVGEPCIIEYDKERQECLNSLRHHGTRYDKISTAHDGTLEWLWEHEKYKAWSSTPQSDLLLIEGKPGSGKSTLTKYFMDNRVEREPLSKQAIVASFFYSYRDGELHRNHSNMLRSILYDILHQNEAFFFHFQSNYRNAFQSDGGFQWPYECLKKILLSFGGHPVQQRLYLIIDAMDESNDNDRLSIIKLLHQLCATTGSCIIKVFLASRPITGLNQISAEPPKTIKLQEVNERDILDFAESFLDQNLGLTPKLLDEAKKYITKNAQGVFVWVHLVKEELCKYAAKGYTAKEISDFLRSLPTELDGFYERMLHELAQNDLRDIKIGVRMFQIVLFAFRPLRVADLRHALAIPDDLDAHFSPSDETFENELIMGIENRIVHCGGNFLEIKGNISVQIMHQTVREFFLRNNKPAMELEFSTNYDDPDVRTAIIWLCYRMHYVASRVQVMYQIFHEFFNEPIAKSRFRMSYRDSHIRISIICFRYLMLCAANTSLANKLPSVDGWISQDFEAYAEYLNKRPFITYALSHLTQHRRECTQLVNFSRFTTLLCEKLSNNPAFLLFKSWIESHLHQNIATAEKKSIAKEFRNNLLHVATRMKYPQVVEAVLTAGANKEACLGGKTPLIVSAESGDVATAEVLLRNEARIDAKDDRKQTALLLAATKGHNTMVSLLVNSGANKEERDDGYERTALHFAASNGHDSTVLLLVRTLGADKMAKDRINWTALHHAAWNGHDSTVRVLVEELGVDMEDKDSIGTTSLHITASGGHES